MSSDANCPHFNGPGGPSDRPPWCGSPFPRDACDDCPAAAACIPTDRAPFLNWSDFPAIARYRNCRLSGFSRFSGTSRRNLAGKFGFRVARCRWACGSRSVTACRYSRVDDVIFAVRCRFEKHHDSVADTEAPAVTRANESLCLEAVSKTGCWHENLDRGGRGSVRQRVLKPLGKGSQRPLLQPHFAYAVSPGG